MPSRAATTRKPEPAARLLAWYDVHARTLPWRAKRGQRPDPYRVWLSEIMLQQTTVAAVGPYYRKFLDRWPRVEALAAAELDDVLTAWAGLGYYARARNLHRAAKVVAEELGGRFPVTLEGLRQLPGVGPYTAGAIAAIAYDLPESAMDANAERVIARLFAIETPMPKAKAAIRDAGRSLVPAKRAGDFAQAVMDLGSAICTPKRPACGNCPWRGVCVARAKGIQETLPVRAAERVRPLKRGAAFVARDGAGAILLVRRAENGLLGGMMQPPLGPWTDEFPAPKEALLQAPFRANWKKRAGLVRHGFTHFELEIEVYVANVAKRPKRIRLEDGPRILPSSRGKVASAERASGEPANAIPPPDTLADARASTSRGKNGAHIPEIVTRWVSQGDLASVALPTVMRKILAHALDDGGPLFAHTPVRKRR